MCILMYTLALTLQVLVNLELILILTRILILMCILMYTLALALPVVV